MFRTVLRIARWAMVATVIARVFAEPPQSVSKQTKSAGYTVVHSIVADGEEFVSVVVKSGISDSELTAVATELHRLHPRSHVTFYDQMDVNRIKHYWTCFLETLHNVFDDPRCPDAPDRWASEHNIGSVGSYYDNPKHTGQPKWWLEGKLLRRIAYLGTDYGVTDTAPEPGVGLPKAGDTAKLHFGQLPNIEAGPTPRDYGEFTKCFDSGGTVDCVSKLLDAQRILRVPSGTRVRLLVFADNPYRVEVLKGRLVQFRVLEGAFRDRTMWTLEDRILK